MDPETACEQEDFVAPLNDRQRSTLQLIGDGDDLNGEDRVGLRISARALASRGLVKVRRADGKWQATITDAGRNVLDQIDTTSPTNSGLPPRQQRRTPENAESGPARPNSAPVRPAAPGARRQAALSMVERLVQDRKIIVSDPTQAERAHLRKTIHYAKQHELEPEGHFIECTGADRGDLTISLATGVHPNAARKRAAALAPVPVPQRLDRPHPVVAALRDDARKLVMPKQLRRRALLLMQALAAAAVERGWQVRDRSSEFKPHYSGVRQTSEQREGRIWVEVDGYSYPVTIDQEFPQTLDPVKSQTLKIELPPSKSGSRSRLADRKTGTLEDRLPEVLEGLADRTAQDRERTAIEARQAEEQERACEQAETDAHSKAVQGFLAETLRQQAASFELSRVISAYCDALEERIAAADPAFPERESALRWLEWARNHAAEIDPLRHLPTMPDAPAFTPEQLEHYAEGAGVAGPQQERFRPTQGQSMDPALTLLQLQTEKSSFRRWRPRV
jgi:hypothetical protein